MIKKFLVFLLIGIMAVSVVACSSDEKKPASDPEPTPTVEAEVPKNEGIDHTNDLPADASSYLGFEDGAMAFAALMFSNPACNLESELSIVDFGGSKALKASSPVSENLFSGVVPYVAFDVVSLLGDKAADVAKIQFDIGMDHGTDAFAAISGYLAMYTGAADALVETKEPWSIFLEEANPKVYTIAVPEGGFTDPSNYFCFYIDEDTSANGHANLYFDNIVFLDKDGNAIAPDAAATFALEGMGDSFWMNLDWSNAVKQPKDEVILEGIGGASGTSWWPVKENSWSFALENPNVNAVFSPDLFGPGKVITIYYQYECDDWQFPHIMIQSYANEETGYAGGKDLRYQPTLAEGEASQRNQSKTIIQYTYEEMNEKCTELYGEDWVDKLSFIGVSDMGTNPVNVLKVTIGTIAE